MGVLHAKDLRGLSCLIASPCDFTREILLYALSAYGAEDIREAVNGADAAILLRERPVNVLLADLHMTPIDGATLTRLVRCEEVSLPRPTTITLLCDAPTAQDVLAARDAGIDDLVRFPISPETLHRRLQRCLLKWHGFPAVDQTSSRSRAAEEGFEAPEWLGFKLASNSRL